MARRRQSISAPFSDDIDEAVMSTEIALIQSKCLALRVARELHLDENDKFMRTGLSSQVQSLFSQVLEGLGLSRPNTSDLTEQAKETPEQADAALDAAAEQLRGLIKADREGCPMFCRFRSRRRIRRERSENIEAATAKT
jgi:uncharacterized protein involved in exopolysaccharide biosynthesis